MNNSARSRAQRSYCRQWTLTCSVLFVVLLAIAAATVIPLALRYVGPGSLGDVENLALNDRQLVSSTPQLCERIEVTAEDELDGVSATMFLTKDPQSYYYEPDFSSRDNVLDGVQDECVVPADGETSCFIEIPVALGYFVFLKTNSSDGMAGNSNHTLAFSLNCEPRFWLYVVIAASTTAVILLCGCMCLCCCACLCKPKKPKEESSNLFIYTPLIDHTSTEGETESGEHSLMVGSISSPSSTKKQDAKTLQMEASTSYRYSTFKPGTKPGGSRSPYIQEESKDSSVPSKASSGTAKTRTVSTISYTVNTFKPI